MLLKQLFEAKYNLFTGKSSDGDTLSHTLTTANDIAQVITDNAGDMVTAYASSGRYLYRGMNM